MSKVSAGRVAALYLARHFRQLYHGTSSENLEAIRRGGVRGDPARRLFEDEVDRPMAGHIYLTPDAGLAMEYAGRSSTKFGGDPMILVFKMRPDDPRFVADEDHLSTIRGYIIEADLLGYRGKLREDLRDLWELVDVGETDPLDTTYGSREHVAVLMDLERYSKISRSLGQLLEIYKKIVGGERSPFAAMADDLPEADLKRHADRLTRNTLSNVKALFHKLAPHPWIPINRIMEFAANKFLHDLCLHPGKYGKNKREAWAFLQEGLVREWPEWFGPEAALIGHGGSRSRTVALKAPSLKPNEAWIITKAGPINSYGDIGRRGEMVEV